MGLASKAEDFNAFVDFIGDRDLCEMLFYMMRDPNKKQYYRKEQIVYQYLLRIIYYENDDKDLETVITAFELLDTVKPKYQ